MEPLVFLAVLAAALLHAGWNAVVKVGLDPFLTIVLISLSAGVIALVLLPLVPVPQADVWWWLITSAFLHVLYNLSLVQAYRTGELGQVYPIARGGAPLLVALVGALVLGERQAAATTTGIIMLVLGVWLMALRGGRVHGVLERRAVLFALATSGCIACYTIVDGLGARRSGDAAGYTLYLFVVDALLMLGVCTLARGPQALTKLGRAWRDGIAGGAMSLFAYGIVIWAMTQAPLAAVAALRETSVLFALLISSVILREPPTRWRIAAGLLILAGAASLRLT
jgi:drug/metabolite transporter (DMT)-like permease